MLLYKLSPKKGGEREGSRKREREREREREIEIEGLKHDV